MMPSLLALLHFIRCQVRPLTPSCILLLSPFSFATLLLGAEPRTTCSRLALPDLPTNTAHDTTYAVRVRVRVRVRVSPGSSPAGQACICIGPQIARALSLHVRGEEERGTM